MSHIQWAFLLAGAAGLVMFSWRSLRKPGSHGFYRFFALFGIFVLLALNGPYWLVDKFAPLQLVSWALLFTALFLVLDGLWLLISRGKPGTRPDDGSLLAFEQTGVLVTTGVYRWIRHPMYLSLLLFAWGIFFKQPGVAAGVTAAGVSVLVFITARVEESECLEKFGSAYEDYRHHSRMFVPLVF